MHDRAAAKEAGAFAIEVLTAVARKGIGWAHHGADGATCQSVVRRAHSLEVVRREKAATTRGLLVRSPAMGKPCVCRWLAFLGPRASLRTIVRLRVPLPTTTCPCAAQIERETD